jgi:hypothetical protein
LIYSIIDERRNSEDQGKKGKYTHTHPLTPIVAGCRLSTTSEGV